MPQTIFADYHLLRRGATVWLLSQHSRLPALASLRVESVGLPLLRQVNTYLKPTTAALQVFGNYATRNVVNLASSQLTELVANGILTSDFAFSSGYVIVETEGIIIGCALYLPGRLISQFPRHLFTAQTWEDLSK
ncbi:MAG: hypothetical protein JSU72_02260 [Deltaproteobacteria bacterium]|nr:MAG: hypothetical protein JSU72_02260 [Deltaproteobacteria bacterium]